jgi:hypothetical protein
LPPSCSAINQEIIHQVINKANSRSSFTRMLTFKRADKLSKKASQIFIPVIDGKVAAPEISKLFDLNLEDELAFFASSEKPLKAGEIFEIPSQCSGLSM